MNARAAEYRGLRSIIERFTLAGHSSAETGNWIGQWKVLREEGWDVQVLTEERQTGGRRAIVALVGMAYKPGTERRRQRSGSHPRSPARPLAEESLPTSGEAAK